MNSHGVFIDDGLQNWQILQQNPQHGSAELRLSGRWQADPNSTDKRRHRVYISIIDERTGSPVSDVLTYCAFPARADGTWTAKITVPVGGLYRLQTALWQWGDAGIEWAKRGDMRHHWGVGDIWVIAGQSNAAGYGKDPIEDPPEMGIHMFGNDCAWRLATHPLNESTHSAHPANTENANPGHSPWIAYAKRLRAVLGYPIGLATTALGGSSLSQWDPKGKADLHAAFTQVVQQQLHKKIAGVVWYQGESDANIHDAPTYKKRFIRTAKAWRKLTHAQLPIITVQLNRALGEDSRSDGWTLLREAQYQISQELEHCAVVPSTDLPLCDQVHTSSAGNMTLGLRCAQAALAVAYQQGDTWAPPVPTHIERMGGKHWRIQCAISGSLMLGHKNADSLQSMICIYDENDMVIQPKSVQLRQSSIDIYLHQPHDGPVRIHVLPGSNPCPFPPHTIPGYLPLLARANLKG